jgi:hypothetical protein
MTTPTRREAPMTTTTTKTDTRLAAINDEANAMAVKLDTLEIGAGAAITQPQIDLLAGISAQLKALGAPLADETKSKT